MQHDAQSLHLSIFTYFDTLSRLRSERGCSKAATHSIFLSKQYKSFVVKKHITYPQSHAPSIAIAHEGALYLLCGSNRCHIRSGHSRYMPRSFSRRGCVSKFGHKSLPKLAVGKLPLQEMLTLHTHSSWMHSMESCVVEFGALSSRVLTVLPEQS